jgi:alpha-beta hydrolase superfamily lysophospholipase
MSKRELAFVTIPVLIQHGGKDKIASLKGSQYLKENLINAPTELMVYPDSYHTLLWDNDSSQVFNDIASWIKGK